MPPPSSHFPAAIAASGGHTETVKVLLNAGADAKATDNDGTTSLHMGVPLPLCATFHQHLSLAPPRPIPASPLP